MANGRTVNLEMEEYRELLMLKGRIVSLEEYVKNANFIDKDVILAIMGISTKKEVNDAGTDWKSNGSWWRMGNSRKRRIRRRSRRWLIKSIVNILE